jgi:hypothetical protein
MHEDGSVQGAAQLTQAAKAQFAQRIQRFAERVAPISSAMRSRQ